MRLPSLSGVRIKSVLQPVQIAVSAELPLEPYSLSDTVVSGVSVMEKKYVMFISSNLGLLDITVINSITGDPIDLWRQDLAFFSMEGYALFKTPSLVEVSN